MVKQLTAWQQYNSVNGVQISSCSVERGISIVVVAHIDNEAEMKCTNAM